MTLHARKSDSKLHPQYIVDLESFLALQETIEDTLAGDGSTSTMPDVTPSEAARYIAEALVKSVRFQVIYIPIDQAPLDTNNFTPTS